jgi:hypothetical protein
MPGRVYESAHRARSWREAREEKVRSKAEGFWERKALLESGLKTGGTRLATGVAGAQQFQLPPLRVVQAEAASGGRRRDM